MVLIHTCAPSSELLTSTTSTMVGYLFGRGVDDDPVSVDGNGHVVDGGHEDRDARHGLHPSEC